MYDLFTKGGPLMWPLLACSFIAGMVAIERLLAAWGRRRGQDLEKVEKMLDHAERGEFDAAADLGRAAGDETARVLAAGLDQREHGLTESMEIAAMAEIEARKRGLGVLDTIITLAPLLGILGTVLGIIQSFNLLGEAGVEQPREVIGGIAEALITTAAGLTIAVATLIPFNFFIARIAAATRRLEKHATQMEIAYRKGVAALEKQNQAANPAPQADVTGEGSL